MSRNFYYRQQSELVHGSANFAALLATDSASYGISSAQSAAFGILNAALQNAYSKAIEPSTGSPVAIADKNLSIRNMRASAILLAKIIAATPTVTDAQLIGLGLLPRATRSPRPAPATAPFVEVGIVSGRLVNLRLHSSESAGRGIEAGARGANLYSYVGATAPADPRDYRFERMTTRAIAQIIFPNDVPSGATVWLSARWVGSRGQVGPTGNPVCFTLQGGPAVPGARAA